MHDPARFDHRHRADPCLVGLLDGSDKSFALGLSEGYSHDGRGFHLTSRRDSVIYSYIVIQAERRLDVAAVKIGASRQVAIPKKLHDELGLSPGDYLEVERHGDGIIMTPKSLVEKRLAEALDDVKGGRMGGPHDTVEELIRALHSTNRRRKARASRRSA
jgi:AbrB family looped-hinge helix DNA binding protein